MLSRTFRSMFFIPLGILILVLGLSFPVSAQPTPITKTIPLVCSNNSTDDLLEVSYDLTAIPQDDVIEGQPVEIQFTGVGYFSEELLQGAVDMFPFMDELRADAMNATAVVRSGATGGGPVLLNPNVSLPQIFPLPDPLAPIAMPLTTGSATFTPGAAGTDILVGWDESYQPPFEPAWSVGDAPGPNGARASIQVIIWVPMGLECYMGTWNDNGTPEDPLDDFTDPLPDSELLAIPVEADPSAVGDVPSYVHNLSVAPNPFNPITTVSYTIPEDGNVILDVYDVRGAFIKNLVNENRQAGTYSISWNGTDSSGRRVPSGVYALRIRSKAGYSTKKITLAK